MPRSPPKAPDTVRDDELGSTAQTESGGASFDPAFYRAYYDDLPDGATDAILRAHFQVHRTLERRFGTSEAMLVALQCAHGPLPADFRPRIYRGLHRDLQQFDADWQLAAHYLQHGAAEGRSYRPDIPDHEAEYAVRRRPGDPETFVELVIARGLSPGHWLRRFNTGDFALLNADWLPRRPSGRLDALLLFLDEGLDRLAPIAVDLVFDPSFYRSIDADRSSNASEALLYRHWLSFGLGFGEPGSEAQFLTGLIGEAGFPDSFELEAYRAALVAHEVTPSESRAVLLEHFIQFGIRALDEPFIRGQGAAKLYEQIGDYHLIRGDAALAKTAYDRALQHEPGIAHRHHKRGDALRALGRHAQAAADFVAATAEPSENIWSHIHAIEGQAFLLDQPEAALAQLERAIEAAQTFPQHEHWRESAWRVLGRYFDHEGARLRDLYVGSPREAADGVQRLLERLTQVIAGIEPRPAGLPAPREGPIVLVANRDLPQCDHYRVTQRAEQLRDGGWPVEIYDQHHPAAYRPALDRARAVIFYRVAAFPRVIHAIAYASALGLPTLYDIDDLIFDADVYPDPIESFEGQITQAEYAALQFGVPLFRYAMSLCETGLASTPALAEWVGPLVRSRTCHVLRNGLDSRNARFLRQSWRPFSDQAATIFYGSGTRAHNRDFTELAAPALVEALRRHPEARLVVAGYLHLDARFTPFLDRIRILGFVGDVEAYWDILSGCDINLAVLVPSPTTDAKSEIKWLEAAMCAIPSIVSPTRTYREVLVDGEDALMAASAQDWTDALDRLLSDPSLRRRIGAAARAKALASYGTRPAIDILRTALPAPDRPEPRTDEPPRPARAPTGRKTRLLIVHVFFPPQTYGGATRVVRDNVDHLIDHAADTFELAVATSDEGAGTPYATRIDAYRGVPVYRIAAPRADRMDWRASDSGMRAPFEALLERFDPDLVHVHCIQRLTGSVVEAVRERGTPYVVTVHDAWWLSDFQFLIDDDHIYREPQRDPLLAHADRAIGPALSIARRRRLGGLLDDADAVLAVSETFARLYRQAGHSGTRAIPNGISRFAPLPRRRRGEGRVRLGHVGDRSAHKGATLVEAVLRDTLFENLSLTIVDNALNGDTRREDVWGTTPVTIIAQLPQARVAELYAELDVLLAPSIWPESFGLVTREAHAAGLWVVASDRGAIGEDIVEGIDGFRIEVGTMEGLRGALKRIDGDPDRFRESPPAAAIPPRTMRDQGRDLVAFYAEILGRACPST